MDKEIRIGKEILVLAHKLKRTIDKDTAQYGVTSIQGRIIGFVYNQSKSRDIFQKDIEAEFNIRRSSVTSVLQLMERNKLIKRVNVSEDARLKKIILMEKGLEIQEHVHNSIDKMESRLKDEFTDDELDTFINLIRRLSKKVDE
ncbi:MarR family winged helix-turn-helix transcriptional regulator [Clostridium neuense]|uniref:MarR family winged helix-turn-helix transcriptional regulator n=1 Tax=Clostridium neuense TaxID=1728934 RepID=A0ABW8TL09_9CLOT